MRLQCDLSVHFLDADGTVFNKNYHEGRKQKNLANYSEESTILAANKWLLKFIAIKIKQAGQGQLESFSMRQSPFAEKDNAETYDTSSFCGALTTLHAKLQEDTKNCCKLEKYLLADTLNRNEAGEAFEIARRILNYPVSESADFPSDMLKISMLYAKIQRVVAENPDKKNIRITVWDDNFFPVLEVLYKFFKDYPELIPQRVVLCFMHHQKQDGECFEFGEPLKGTGDVNPFYEALLRAFYNSKEYRKFENEDESDPLTLFSPDFQAFKDQLRTLHRKALEFSQVVDQGVSIVHRRDQYNCDMISCYVKDKKKNLRAIFDLYAEKKIKKTDFVAQIWQKIHEAKIEEELLSIINFINSPSNRALLEQGERRSFMHRTTTCDHLVEMARCEMLHIYAKNNPLRSIDNRKEYEDFTRYLSLRSGCNGIVNTAAPHFFVQTKSLKRREKTSRQATQDLRRHGHALAKLYRP